VARTDFFVPDPTPAQFLGSSRGALRIWLNGSLAFQRQASSGAAETDRFDVALRRGINHLLVELTSTHAPDFSLRFRRKCSDAEREQLMQAALSRSGNAAWGRKLFFQVEKSQCLKCHRMADRGEAIGPELTGVGGRFSRVHIIESILEPSRTIAPSFQSVEFLLRDGTELSGIQISERDGMLTLADNQGHKRTVAKSAIQQQRTGTLSLMPEVLEKALTREEFIDLIEFLVSQRQNQRP
jgi:putative heme-binding domain-containing protein